VVITGRLALLIILLAITSCAFAPTVGAQQEPLTCFGEPVTIVGTEGNDRLKGTRHRDVIQALGGNDVVRALGGNDVVCGDAGDDRIDAGRGDDTIHDETGDDRLAGGPGDDRLFGNYGHDHMDGGSGNDELWGGSGDDEDFNPGNDHLKGGPGNDLLHGGHGDDHVVGGPGDDQLFGELGDDELSGGPGDDLLDGGPGDDRFSGGPGNDTIVDEPPPPPPPGTLVELIDANDRTGIRAWADARSIATINSEIAALDQARRDHLAEVVLDTNATGEPRDKMLRVIRAVLAVPELGFYAEIWSYTFVELTGGGFFGTCNHLFLSPDAWGGLSDADARAVLMHETFHSFNCINGGPAGALDEGSAIWITHAPFDTPVLPGQSLAEATYGSKLFHKVFFNNPNLPITAPLNPTQKLLDVYAYLAAHDPSKLPWNSTERLVTCFDRYFADLDRNVDFFNVWLPAVKERTDLMLADAECKPL
jgi:hypothetical protein